MIPRAFIAVALAACAHGTSTVADVPIAFGRWRPRKANRATMLFSPPSCPRCRRCSTPQRSLTALGGGVLTLRVLIDTAGTIAHAEISRAAAAGVDRARLVAELARYRFHPGLEDRVRTPSWVILRIK